MTAILTGFRDGEYDKNETDDVHEVLILDYKDGYFLISDSDAPYEGTQGHFVWVSAEVIAQSFSGGNSIILN